jgi:hypothetical protein
VLRWFGREPSPDVNAVPESTQGSSMDRIQEWAALIGRRNIAFVVFVSLPQNPARALKRAD